MAITNKAAIQALIDAYTANITLYITSNNNKEITGAQLKQILDESSVILEDLKDSYFNLLDEPRTALSVSFTALNALDWDVLPTEVKGALDELAERVRDIEEEANQTAFETPYTPTTPANWGVIVPTEVRAGLDILAQKTLKNASEAIAYVSKQGSDTINEFEIGNSLKPFLTIQAAADALPATNAVLIVLGGGTYTEDVVITTKTNWVIDFNNCTLTGIVNLLLLENSAVTNVNILNAANQTEVRTRFINNIYINNSVLNIIGQTDGRIFNSNFISSSVVGTLDSFGDYSDFNNCIIENTGSGSSVYRASTSRFRNCQLISVSGANIQPNIGITLSNVVEMWGCNLKTSGINIGATSGASNIIMNGCKIYSTANYNLNIRSTLSNICKFISCEFYTDGTREAIFINSLLARTAGTQTFFKDCTFFTGTAYAFIEPVVYDVNDFGETVLINCIMNKTAATLAPTTAKIVEQNSFYDPNLQNFNNI